MGNVHRGRRIAAETVAAWKWRASSLLALVVALVAVNVAHSDFSGRGHELRRVYFSQGSIGPRTRRKSG